MLKLSDYEGTMNEMVLASEHRRINKQFCVQSVLHQDGVTSIYVIHHNRKTVCETLELQEAISVYNKL